MINFFIKTEETVDSAIRMIRGKAIHKLNRMYIINNMKVIFNNDDTVCVVKYKKDIVPLFVFSDQDSVLRLKKAIMEEYYDGLS